MADSGWARTDKSGTSADLSVSEAANGLITRFDTLLLPCTGFFETSDGCAHPL
jgi:hypothetical protein